MCRKTNHRGRRLAWLNREILLGLRRKRRDCHLRNNVRSCRGEIRKTKAQLELRLANVVRDNKKCFYNYINNKKRAKENLHLLLDEGGEYCQQG